MKRNKLIPANKVWFTSDTHFSHGKILKYDNRPFKDINEHDKQIITNWNHLVMPDDLIFHLGDFAFGNDKRMHDILKQLNGNIILIKGNHDRIISKHQHLCNMFHDIREYTRIGIKDNKEPLKVQSIVLFHYPIDEWDGYHRGSWHLHGHRHGNTHNNTNKRKNRLDISTNLHGYKPLSYNEIKDLITK